jgi:hypothetical protein
MSLKTYSFRAIVFIFLFIISVSFCFHLWNTNRIIVDAPNYYAYLPAAIIHHDLKLRYIDQNPAFYKGKIWFDNVEGGRRLIMHPMGVSLVLTPFFLIGNLIAGFLGDPQDGYSMPCQNALSIGILIYLFIGLFYLRRVLLNYFSEKITALTLISIVLGSNLIWYSTFEGLMSHSLSFSFWSICMYAFFQWLKTGHKKYVLTFSVIFGLMILLRLLSVLLIFYFILFTVFSKGGIKKSFEFVRTNLKMILTGIFLTFITVSIQFCYWKYATGHWIYDVYFGQHFMFNSPQILPFLFSFRKGVFVYTPILVFSVIGMVGLYRSYRSLFYSTFIFMCLIVYVLSSWWAWSYGISWGMRPMIDYYTLLSIPMAAGFTLLSSQGKTVARVQYVFVGLFIVINLFQTWQYKNELIHYDDMSKDAYFAGFFQTTMRDDWKDLLKPYDWDRRLKGLPQTAYSKHFFENLGRDQAISLRGSNLFYVVVNPKAKNAIASLARTTTDNGLFYIEHLGADTVCLRSKSGLLWSLQFNYENAITVTGFTSGITEKFTVDYLKTDDNQIALKACNGKYISIGTQWPFILQANAERITKYETFRYFYH